MLEWLRGLILKAAIYFCAGFLLGLAVGAFALLFILSDPYSRRAPDALPAWQFVGAIGLIFGMVAVFLPMLAAPRRSAPSGRAEDKGLPATSHPLPATGSRVYCLATVSAKLDPTHDDLKELGAALEQWRQANPWVVRVHGLGAWLEGMHPTPTGPTMFIPAPDPLAKTSPDGMHYLYDGAYPEWAAPVEVWGPGPVDSEQMFASLRAALPTHLLGSVGYPMMD